MAVSINAAWATEEMEHIEHICWENGTIFRPIECSETLKTLRTNSSSPMAHRLKYAWRLMGALNGWRSGEEE